MAAEHADLKILKEFELAFHEEMYDWVALKIPEENASILDISIDHSTFTSLLSPRLKGTANVTRLMRSKADEGLSAPGIQKTISMKYNPDAKFVELDKAGKFDVIVIKESLHEVINNMEDFFIALKTHNLKGANSKIFVVIRPRNPPVPLPDSGVERWRKTAPTREALLELADAAGFCHECYAVSCPVSIPKEQWKAFLTTRCMPALQNNPRTTNREIEDFISSKPSPKFTFEEKLLVFLFTPKT